MKQPQAITLRSDKVKLIPLTMAHLDAFYQAGKDDSLWCWVAPHRCRNLGTTKEWLQSSLAAMAGHEQMAFVIVDIASDQIVGSTRYCSIDVANKGVEIGFTFIRPDFQRSYINSHCKFLLLQHAFEELGAIRVQFRTHQGNQKSRNAIARLGATLEGVIRHQRVLDNGEVRNAALFSIIDSEWPQVKLRLQNKLIAVPEAICQLSDEQQQLLANFPLVQLVIASSDNVMNQIIYLPMTYDENRHCLSGHLSVNNKLNWLLDNSPNVTLVVRGDDNYISPSWHDGQVVPTWNYQVLHMKGKFGFICDDDSQQKFKLMAQQVSIFEGEAWQLAQQEKALMMRMIAQIRCFEVSLTEAALQNKLSHKKPMAVRHALADKLSALGKKEFAIAHL